MLISKQQRFLLDILTRLGCARRNQLYAMAAKSLERGVEPGHVDAMLNQLRCRADIRLEGNLVKLPRAIPDERLLEAVDVMLELSGGAPLDFDARQSPPVLLRFTLGGDKLRLFAVTALPEGGVSALSQIARRRTERVVVLLPGETPPSGVLLPDKHFFAMRREDGTHRFFAAGGQ